MNEPDKDQDPKQGIQESRQDRKQDNVAKQRPGQCDQQVRDAHSRSPRRKDGGQEPGQADSRQEKTRRSPGSTGSSK